MTPLCHTSKTKIDAIIYSLTSDEFKLQAELHVLPKVIGQYPTRPLPHTVRDQFAEFPLADPGFNCPGRIDIQLGTQHYSEILLHGMQKLNGFLIQETEFGWMVSGGNNPGAQQPACMITRSADVDLSRFREHEEMAQSSMPKPEDEICEHQFQATTERDEEGRFIVKLPEVPVTMTNVIINSRKIRPFRQPPISPHCIMLFLLGGLTMVSTTTFTVSKPPNGILVERLGNAYLRQGAFKMQIIYQKSSMEEQIRTAQSMYL